MCGNTLFWSYFREMFSPVFQYLQTDLFEMVERTCLL